jgi:tungstate transport system substrate-binding protein
VGKFVSEFLSKLVNKSVLVLTAMLVLLAGCDNSPRPLRLASTTTTENSGLMGYLLPQFTDATGVSVKLISMGTGQALRMAENGDLDLLLVHAPEAEALFIDKGFGVKRTLIMSNYFYLVGPASDPAGVQRAKTIQQALQKIEISHSLFISRGDESGTHKKEQMLWQLAHIDPTLRNSEFQREVGAGMGKTLNVAAAMNGYTLVDKGTWLSFNNPQDLVLLFSGDDNLYNPYHLIELNPEKYPHINQQYVKAFADWLSGPLGQKAIAEFEINGQRLFDPAQDDM